jgi:hypothetical protein
LLANVSVHANAQVTKLIDYLRLWIAYRRNDFQVVADWNPKCDVIRSPFSSHFGAKFDPSAGTMRVLSRAFVNNGDSESGLLWAELFLKWGTAAKPGELAKAFQLRGSALVLALERSLSVGKVADRNAIAQEAITSFYIASDCYQRVGGSYEDVYSRLMLIDLMQDWSGFAAGPPRWFTDIGTFDLKIEYRAVDINFLLKDLEIAIKRLMDPLFVIHTQVCCARQFPAQSQTDFSYAVRNVKKFFLRAQTFVAEDLSIKRRWHVLRVVRRMCCVLMDPQPTSLTIISYSSM